jgi:hypothetical protein
VLETVVVIGDIHAQEGKLWRMLEESGAMTAERLPSARMEDGRLIAVLLGDLVHAKSREAYAKLIGTEEYDEFDAEHVARAVTAQEEFLRRVRDFHDACPVDGLRIILGNHDHDALHPDEGPIQSDDVIHFEWKRDRSELLPDDLTEWIANFESEVVIDNLHFAHNGPLAEHNAYGESFYREDRRRWIREDRDFLADIGRDFGVYGHTPIRGGLTLASKGRAMLLDLNGYGEEYAFLTIDLTPRGRRLRLRGTILDAFIER